jgi:spermidine/putrescine transport system substrate-binding protein
MEKVNPDNVENKLIFPDEELLASTHTFMALKEYQIRAYEGDFADVTSG